GGRLMLEAAATGAREGARGTACEILAVTVLTSMDSRALSVAWGRPVSSIQDEVLRLGQLALDAGIHGVVCGGEEAAAVKSKFGDRIATLVPGVRLPGSDKHDQARAVTPRAAAEAGARYVVIGR